MVGNICPLHCGQEHPLPCQKTAAGDTSCLLMMLNVFKSTMSNFLPLWMDSWGGKEHFLPFFLYPLPVRKALRSVTDRHFRSCPCQWDRGAQPMLTIGAFIWDHKYFHGTKPAKPWSVTTPSLPVVSVLLCWMPFLPFRNARLLSSAFIEECMSQGDISCHCSTPRGGWLHGAVWTDKCPRDLS